MTIGQRAAQMIRETAEIEGLKVSEELKLLDMSRQLYSAWRKGISEPSAYYLQQLALSGYDIFWILTGERSYPVENTDFEVGEYEEDL